MQAFYLGQVGIVGLLFVITIILCENLSTAQSGGCASSSGNGFQVGICISNMNGMAISDMFVDQSATTTDCHMDIQTWNENIDEMVGSTTVDCSAGHKVALPLGPFSNAMILHSYCVLTIAGTQYSIGASPSVTIQSARDLTYNYGYVLAYPPTPSAQQMLQMATNNFQALFTFHNCGNVISVGQICHLGTGGPGGDNPIEVVAIGTTSFTFLSLPGHAEGAGRLITFSFVVDPMTLRLYLDVAARGSWTIQAELTRDGGVANNFWKEYANNLQAAIADGTVNSFSSVPTATPT